LLTQASNQTIRSFAPSKVEINDSYVRKTAGEQDFGVGDGRRRSSHGRPTKFKQYLYRLSDISRILDQEDI
jgi:hypothetical protein